MNDNLKRFFNHVTHTQDIKAKDLDAFSRMVRRKYHFAKRTRLDGMAVWTDDSGIVAEEVLDENVWRYRIR